MAYCTRCGKEINDAATFCKYCGAKVGSSDAVIDNPKNEVANKGISKTVLIIIGVALALVVATTVIGIIMYFGKSDDTVLADNTKNAEAVEPEGNSSQSKDEASNTESATSKNNKIPEDAIEYNGHFYKVYNDSMLWTEAEKSCESMDGHLVVITSDDEQRKVVEMIEKYAAPEKLNFWIGGSDAEHEGVFKWVTGESIPLDMSVERGYENWKSGQPNNNDTSSEGDQDYLQICCTDISDTDRYGKWYDMSDTGLSQSYEGPPYYKDPKYSGYICEWDSAN